ncbi:hypothetical protein HYV79_03275 [Candidatus Woesearchaeota archaeon]|nr:hypothetical protein [Candidatus Woesearchaeota archaeon]
MKYETILLGLFALFALTLISINPSLTGMYAVENAKPLTLKDKTYRFFSIEEIYFQEKNDYCQKAVKSILNDSISVSPHKTSYVHFKEEEGLGVYAYSNNYLTGTLSLVKGKTFIKSSKEMPAELQLKSKEVIFGRYSDLYHSIEIELKISGEIDEDALYVSSGSVKLNGFNCSFEEE